MTTDYNFTDDDWNSFHDTVFDAIEKSLKREELWVIFTTLPEDLKWLAYRWGMADSVFNDKAYRYLEE